MDKNFRPHQTRNCIKPGDTVDIVLKKDQPTGALTRGVVRRILTNSSTHHRGIKVMLTTGAVGRVQNIVGSTPTEESLPEPAFQTPCIVNELPGNLESEVPEY